MANSGPNTNGRYSWACKPRRVSALKYSGAECADSAMFGCSQFFITFKAQPSLNGKSTSGACNMSLLEKIYILIALCRQVYHFWTCD